MSVFAKRLKNGRRWSIEGITKLSNLMVALMDGQKVITQRGVFQQSNHFNQKMNDEKRPKYFVERFTCHVQEMTRGNIAYLQQSIHKPIVEAVKGLKGYDRLE